MTALRWGNLSSTSDGYTVELLSGDTPVAVLRRVGGSDFIDYDGGTWTLSGSPTAGFTASLPDGRVFNAQGEKKRIGRAVVIAADMSGARYRFVNEASSNWIIDDAQDRKVAQFTGAGHGVRHPVIELEQLPSIPQEHAVFAAYIARQALEGKMLSMTMVFTICMALLAPFTVLVYLLS